jgi:hypothetical protein
MHQFLRAWILQFDLYLANMVCLVCHTALNFDLEKQYVSSIYLQSFPID